LQPAPDPAQYIRQYCLTDIAEKRFGQDLTNHFLHHKIALVPARLAASKGHNAVSMSRTFPMAK